MIHYDNTAIEAVNNGQDTPDAFYCKSKLIATSKWHSTDAWRGYYELVPEPGYKLLEEETTGWVTGDWDDAPAGNSSTEVEALIKKLEKKHGDLYVIFTPTSNVFSTSYDVLVRDNENKPPKSKLVAHKTRLYEHENGDWSIRYHATHVVSYERAHDRYTLDTGGWDTMTTRKRINEYLPSGIRVYRDKGITYVTDANGTRELTDGITVQNWRD